MALPATLLAMCCGVTRPQIDRLCNVFPGNTTDERLDFMNDDIRAFYSAQRVNNRLPTLKASNLKKIR